MNTPLDDAAFLALSENRIALLEALSGGQPHNRDELMATTDVSRPTLARILDDLERRAWITQHGQTGQITPLGVWVLEEFTELLAVMDAAQDLRDVMRWWPTDTVSVDILRRLRGAELVFATESDPMAPVSRAAEQVRTGSELRFLTNQVTVPYFLTVRDAVSENGLTVDGVMTTDAIGTLVSDTALADLCAELYASGNTVLFVTDESLPILQIIDGSVGLGLVDTTNTPRGLVLSTDEGIIEWATETFESYREDASRVTARDFSRMQETESVDEVLEAPSG